MICVKQKTFQGLNWNLNQSRNYCAIKNSTKCFKSVVIHEAICGRNYHQVPCDNRWFSSIIAFDCWPIRKVIWVKLRNHETRLTWMKSYWVIVKRNNRHSIERLLLKLHCLYMCTVKLLMVRKQRKRKERRVLYIWQGKVMRVNMFRWIIEGKIYNFNLCGRRYSEYTEYK